MDSDSYSKQQLDDLFMDMIAYYDGDPKRIQHFTKELDDASLFILEAAAYTHDIGIRVAEEKYGRCDGKLQEQEGPIIAQKMLSQLGFENYIVERICFLIGHHHTYDNIDGLDYQILVEADFLVNLYEDDAGNRAIDKAYKRIFKTETGKKISDMKKRISMSRAGRRLPALVRIMQLISEIVINQNSKYAE